MIKNYLAIFTLFNFLYRVHSDTVTLYNGTIDELANWHGEGAAGRTKQTWKLENKIWSVCDKDIEASSNYLITPEIRRQLSKSMQVEIRYMLWCIPNSKANCSNGLEVFIRYTNGQLNSKNFGSKADWNKLTAFKDDIYDKQTTLVTSRKSVSGIKTSHFQIALLSTGVCAKVEKIIVTTKICPAITAKLRKTVRSFAPVEDDDRVSVKCVQHASSQLPDPYDLCSFDGRWTINNNCQCNAGYQPIENDTKCGSCKLKFYKPHEGNDRCIRCPRNSESSPSIGFSMCKCKKNYFRIKNSENTTDCFLRPSIPSNVNADVKNTNVHISWSIPENWHEGYGVLTYTIKCRKCNFNQRFIRNIKGLSYDLQNLKPRTTYEIDIYATGPKDLEGTPLIRKIPFDTDDKLVPYNVRVTKLGQHSVRVSWSAPSQSKLSYIYIIRIVSNEGESSFRSNDTSITINDIYWEKFRVAVRVDSAEPGEYSEYVSFMLPQNGISIGMDARQIGVLIGVIVTMTLLFAVLCFGIMCLYKRKNHQAAWSNVHSFDHIGVDASQMYSIPPGQGFCEPTLNNSLEMLIADFVPEIDEKCLEMKHDQYKNELCQGNFTALLHINRYDPEKVSVKRLTGSSHDELKQRLRIEAAIMGQFNHPNVLKLHGMLTPDNPADPWMLVTESANCLLYTYLREYQHRLTSLQLVHMLRGIACGMHYLSDFGYVHKVLTSGNILLSENYVCKIAGFGMRTTLDDLSTQHFDSPACKELLRYLLPWMAPEVISLQKYSSASDVWSLGIVAWEMMSYGDIPYGEIPSEQLFDAIQSGCKLQPPLACPTVVYQLMLDCWHDDRNRRPWFSQITEVLENIIRHPTIIDNFKASVNYLSLKRDLQAIPDCTSKSQQPLSEWLEAIGLSSAAEPLKAAGFRIVQDLFGTDAAQLKRFGVRSCKTRKRIIGNLAILQFQLRKQALNRSSTLTSPVHTLI